jgi:hypothetical protein
MTEVKIYLPSAEFATIIVCVLEEMHRAQTKHPTWPTDNVKRAAIVCEEAGEVIREANLLDEGKGSLNTLKRGLIQCAGTCLRMLDALSKDADIQPGIIDYFEDLRRMSQ